MSKVKFGEIKDLFESIIDDESDFFPVITDDSAEPDSFSRGVDDVLPILPLKNAVMFPGVIFPITVNRKKSIKLVERYQKENKSIAVVTQKDPTVEDPRIGDLYSIGTAANVLKVLEMPDGSTTVIIQGTEKIELISEVSSIPYLQARVKKIEEAKPKADKEFDILLNALKDSSLQIIKLSTNIPNEASFAIKNINSPSFFINFISSNAETEVKDKQALLEMNNLRERAEALLGILAKQLQLLEIKNDVLSKARKDIDQQQRDYFLQQQMKTIQDELGVNNNAEDVEQLRKKGKEKKWGESVAKVFEKEITKLSRMNPQAPDYSVQLTYVELMCELPWNEYTNDNFDLKNAQKTLDSDHFGLEKVKERILEHLAVLKLKGDMKSPIICLHGPPGVGKTSLGRSIASALGRKYARISLGGMRDEAEIRGHRKTYIGAMPGRIIQNIKKIQSANPVFILDEIDKIGTSGHGDPESALLEVLDPEQNTAFHDNYLDIDFDLSKVMFIATANNISNISSPLRDRMEMIDISGYIIEEKMEIAKRHLIPQQIEKHGLKKGSFSLDKKALEILIAGYTRESGVRQLDKQVAKVARNIAMKTASEEEVEPKINTDALHKILGSPKFTSDIYEGNEFAGVVTGLAWTSVGGDILFIETSISKGKGVLTLTGNLGNVMKESATIALQYFRANSEHYGIKPETLDNWNVHIHVPEGAIPKDGPSAGITMATSITSAFTQRKIIKSLAMTGEITLRGKVLPVGGIKEKILAAKRANIKEIILCTENRKDVEEINEIYIKGLNFNYVSTIDQVLNLALMDQKVKNPISVS
jgi:ATP-dependent Lon protease